MSQNAGHFLVQSLARSGVRRIFGVAGDSLNAITESVRRTENFDWVHVRHEEVAAFAAGAEAHLTDQLTVCAGSCGPGNLHLINGLYDCHRSGVPVLAIAAQIPSSEIGTNYFQETDPQKIFSECSVYCGMVSHAEQLPRMLKIAAETAVARRGVAVLVIPGDIAFSELDLPPIMLPLRTENMQVSPSHESLEAMAGLLNTSQKIVILAGAGCRYAHQELVDFAAKIKAPIVHALRGKEYVEYDNPYDLGMTGLLGFSSGYYAMEHCDLLLMLGTDFPYTQFYPKVKTIQVDHRGEQIGRRTTVNLGVVGDVKETLVQVLPLLQTKDDRAYLDRCLRHYKEARQELDHIAEPGSIKKTIHPQYLVKAISENATINAIFTCDVGTPTVWAARYLKMNGQRRLIGSFNHGSMANAMPQAIGAQSIDRKRQVIALCGDGGFSMLMGDILTIKQYDLPIKLFIFNNSALGFVEFEMMAEGLEPTAVKLKNPDFVRLAEAVGIKGFKIESSQDMDNVLKEAFSHDGPVLIDVPISSAELSIPPHISLDQVKGFGLFGLKTVLSGQGRELIDLVKTNLWR